MMKGNICQRNIRKIYRFREILFNKEKKEVMDMLYKYKEVFSLTDEIGTFPNIEVEINVMDKLPILY